MTQDLNRPLGKMVVGNLLLNAASRFAGREALFCVSTGRRCSFQQINSRSNQLAHALLDLPLQPGSVVAFICSNRSEILEIYGALAKSGLVGLPLNYRLAASEMASLIEAMGAVALICEARFGELLSQLRALVPMLQHFVWIGSAAPEGCHDYEVLLSAAPSIEPDVEVAESDPYYYNLTSGTTGLPKSYVITHYSSCSMLSAILSSNVTADDVFLTVFPAFGRVAFGGLLMSLLVGSRSVLTNFDAADTARLIEEESVTFAWLVPTMASLMLELPNLDAHRFSSLRGIGFVGAKLSPALIEQTQRRLCAHIFEGYGLQETGMLTMSTPEDRMLSPDSVGKPILFSEVRLVDADGTPVATGEVGEIIARSPNCISAYFQSPTQNTTAFRDGWFRTGDLGRFDEDGYLFICGRVKDMIISGGQNIHSSEIEETLLMASGVRECAVIGLPHDIWGEVVTAVIVGSDETQLEVGLLQDFCRKTLAGFKVPRQIFFQLEPLPRTATGKIQKFLLVQRYAAWSAG